MLRSFFAILLQQVQAVWRTVTRTGTGIIVADDTTEGMPVDLEMQGWTRQDSTTGAQLFDIDTFLKLPLEPFANYGNARTLVITLKPNTHYTMSTDCEGELGGDANKNRSLYFATVEDMVINGATTAVFKGKNITQTSDGEGKLKVVLFDRENANPIVNKEKWIMLNEGTAAKPYEQYTGNKPSPSPDYPQEIRNAGKYNEETQKYEWIVKITNKNLFNKEYASKKENWKKGENYPYISIFVGKGNTVSFCYSKELELGLGLYVLISKEPGSTSKSYRWLYHSTAESLINKSGSFMAENDEIYLSVAGAKSTLLEKFMENIGNDLQIEISESPTAYVEHTEQSVTITSDRSVSKWDRLECMDGVYGWVYKTIRVPDFSEIIKENTPIYGDAGRKYFFVELQNTKLNYDKTKIYSETGYYQTGVQEKYVIMPYERSVYIGVEDEDTIETAKEHLHYSIQYETTEAEEFVPLPEEEQAELKALKTYFPTTVFSNDQSLFMQVEYNTKVQEKEGE